MKLIKRIIFLLSFAVLYLIFKEFLEIYLVARSVHPIVGYIALAAIIGVIYYFVGVPIYRIVKIPVAYGPTKDVDEVPELIRKRMEHFRRNRYLGERGFSFDEIPATNDGYQKVLAGLKPETERIRKKYVTQLFYSSSLAQNGFIDAILIFSSSINLVKELFILYNGRVSNRDLLIIARKVYYSIAIGGSEGVEYATQEILSKLSSGGMKSIPFADKIFGSIADGFVNATLLTRIALITENYCTTLYIKSDRDLIPSPVLVIDTAKRLTGDILGLIGKSVKHVGKSSWSRTKDMTDFVVNPMRNIYRNILDRHGADALEDETEKEMLKDSLALSTSYGPFGIGRIIGIFRQSNHNKTEEI